MTLLRNDSNEQASPISEGVVKIRINITFQDNNLTTWHTWATHAPRVTTFRDDYQRVRIGSYLTLVLSSTWYLNGNPWVAWTLSHYTSVKRGKVSSNSTTVEATKLTGPHKSHMCQYIINLVHRSQTIGPQLIQAAATTFGVLNLTSDHSQPFHLIFSTFP
jgi:hypothetical protein